MKLYDNDSHRDTFTELVYSALSDDPTWDRANQIIDSFDSAPAVEVPDSTLAAHPYGGPGDGSIEVVKPAEDDPRTYLKPCRICGNTEIVYERYTHKAGERWRCWCTKCLACIDPGWAQDRLAVREIWNQSPPNDPLTLEELRGMEGEPLYIVSGKFEDWRIPYFIDEGAYKGFVQFTDKSAEPLDSYGKAWLAYRRKPEGVMES